MKQRNGRKLNNRGATMMLAVVIIGVLMIFIFSLLLASYTLFAAQNKKPASRRNSEAANTLSQALEKELTSVNADENSALWKYLRCNVLQDSWPYYDPGTDGHGEADAFRYFNLQYQKIGAFSENLTTSGSGVMELDGFPGSVELCMYWEPPRDEYGAIIPVENLTNKTGTMLHMEIICETASQTYVVTNHYMLTQSTDKDPQHVNALSETAGRWEYYNPWSNPIDSTEKWAWSLDSRE